MRSLWALLYTTSLYWCHTSIKSLAVKLSCIPSFEIPSQSPSSPREVTFFPAETLNRHISQTRHTRIPISYTLQTARFQSRGVIFYIINRVEHCKVDAERNHNRGDNSRVLVLVNIVPRQGTLSGSLHHSRTNKFTSKIKRLNSN